MEYTAVIRTLGTSRDKYLTLLTSLDNQTLPPKEIIVYIAEGFALPRETIGKEKYVYVKKGMMSQRALPYDEVSTEYILFLDDDLYFPSDSVEKMFKFLEENKADVISPDIFPNAKRSFGNEVLMTISARMRARYHADGWGYKVMRNGGYSYPKRPIKDVLFSQTNAGACFLCRKENFVRLNFQDEKWIDAVPYALGDDQVIFYKMFLNSLKILTWYSHGFVHLDAGQNYTKEKETSLIYSDFRFKTIFWYRFVYKVDERILQRFISLISFAYTVSFSFIVSLVKLDWKIFKIKRMAVKEAITSIQSPDFQNLNSVII